MLLSYLVPQLLNVSLLGLKLVAAVLNLPLVKLDFRVYLNESSLGYLVLCFRLQTHVLHLSQVARVFLFNLVVLGVCVASYLLQDFTVVTSLFLYLVDKVLNLFIVLFDIKRVLLSKFLHPGLMIHHLSLMCLDKRRLSQFLLRGKLLVPSSVLQHPLVVFVALAFELFLLILFHFSERLFVALFHVLLAGFELGDFVGRHAASVVQVVIQFVNFGFLLVGAHFIIDGGGTVVRGLVLLLCGVLGRFQVFDFRLFDEDVFAEARDRGEVGLAGNCSGRLLVFVPNVVNYETTVLASSEQELVVET